MKRSPNSFGISGIFGFEALTECPLSYTKFADKVGWFQKISHQNFSAIVAQREVVWFYPAKSTGVEPCGASIGWNA